MEPFEVRLHSRGVGQRNVRVDKNPDICPLCHHGIEPIDVRHGYYSEKSPSPVGRLVERILLCPREECEHYFIARYHESIHSPGFFTLHRCLPYQLEDVQFSEPIATVLKDFCQIYNQAYKAERNGLMLVAGPGYRKATASRAAWLGNDETHYVRKWEQADLESLKKFIQLTMHWIEMEELTKEGEKGMPEGKK